MGCFLTGIFLLGAFDSEGFFHGMLFDRNLFVRGLLTGGILHGMLFDRGLFDRGLLTGGF
jgi:hypothetical protein